LLSLALCSLPHDCPLPRPLLVMRR
jgi:hypothetical protein